MQDLDFQKYSMNNYLGGFGRVRGGAAFNEGGTEVTTGDKVFRWLHFSDIHVGQDGQARLWPRASTLLLDDLETAHRKTGGFDCLVFSGDLVQKGSAREFEEFDKVLANILNRLGDLGERPPVITVPGNHDLSRPDRLNSFAMAFTRFWSEGELRDGMWKADSEYLSFLGDVFRNYSDWRSRAIESGFHLAPTVQGPLPGDASYLLETAAGRVGVIGLNSTWLQLGGGDYHGELHVDARQLLAITEQAPDEWTRANELNLLVTHQPASWLHRDSPASWDADLNPAGRFDLHLFGHMHEPDVTSIAHGGGPARRNVQAASLFGLEKYGEGHTRIQGYSANRITLDGTDRRFTSWPRRLVAVAGGRMKLVPDTSQEIDENTGALSIPYNVERRVIAKPEETLFPLRAARDGAGSRLTSSSFDLAAIHHPVPESKGHLKVRRVEQDACVAALLAGRVVWVTSDWGMGEDGFVASVCARLELSRDKIFSVDFNGYDATDAFFDGLRTRLGGTFQQMCDALAETGPCVLVLDDIDVGSSGTIEKALEDLIRPVSDFAAEAHILIRSRRRPKRVTIPIIELKALDEPDVAIYARESELGGERFAKPDAVSKLLRHTDGVPSRLDDALRDLEIVSLSDLLSANPDYGDAVATSTVPAALVAAVAKLAHSDDRAEERAYNLLLALSGLPQGEQLARLTRFLGPHPFYPLHARTLVERSLVDTITITTLEGLPGDNTQKALIVPRPVREYVRSVMDEKTVKSFDRKALDLYFGDSWASGEITSSPTGRRVRKALCDGYEISNAAALILRSARRSLIEKNEVEIEPLIRLASAFIETLITGDHFRAAASLSEDFIRLLEEFGTFGREVNVLRYGLARSLRMIGRSVEARTEFERLDLNVLSKSQRQNAELGLALTLERLKDDPGAADAARRVIALDRNSGRALHAKVIIAEQIEDATKRTAELQRLLAIALKGSHTVAANNIRLTLAQEEKDDDKASTLLKEVQAPAGSHDFYNSVRAAVELAERRSRSSRLGEAERSRLIDAYHFLYSERLVSLFDRCHEVLWNEFERSDQIANLLNLFRHSSFIWRLNGRESTEARYLARLVKMVQDVIASDNIRGSRDGAYFVVRVSVVMKDLGKSATDHSSTSTNGLAAATIGDSELRLGNAYY
jgi:predicted MPP superfamily phosphohydrolase